MQKYIGTKVIEAKPMTRGDYNTYRGWDIPANENPDDEGYLVKYPDGYESWSPKDVFDRAYRTFDAGMDFGHAIKLMKMGFKAQRKGWNGKGMFLYFVPDGEYAPCTKVAETLVNESGKVQYGAYIAMKTAQGNVVPWLASQTDMLSEDWDIVG